MSTVDSRARFGHVQLSSASKTMNCKEHHLPELELPTCHVREALQCILHTILLYVIISCHDVFVCPPHV
jgi:hypothetical protein